MNRELEILPESLYEAIGKLKPGGRICVLAYHSLESRIVKQVFKKASKSNFNILTPHTLRPSREEIRDNPRSRSAHLRAGEVLH